MVGQNDAEGAFGAVENDNNTVFVIGEGVASGKGVKFQFLQIGAQGLGIPAGGVGVSLRGVEIDVVDGAKRRVLAFKYQIPSGAGRLGQ